MVAGANVSAAPIAEVLPTRGSSSVNRDASAGVVDDYILNVLWGIVFDRKGDKKPAPSSDGAAPEYSGVSASVSASASVSVSVKSGKVIGDTLDKDIILEEMIDVNGGILVEENVSDGWAFNCSIADEGIADVLAGRHLVRKTEATGRPLSVE